MSNVLTYLERTAQQFPDKTAYAYRDARLTFGQLLSGAQALALRIRQTGVQGAPIGVVTQREDFTALLFFAVLYSGNFYVPIDPDSPPEKQSAILQDAQVGILLGPQAYRAHLTQIAFEGLYLTAQDGIQGTCPIPPTSEDTPCYMIYTSGSTGKPKGVLKSHGAVCNFTETYCGQFDLRSDDIFGNQTPFFFDASAKDIYVALKLGATIEVLPTELFAMPPMLIEYMNERRVTFISWVPTALSIVSRLRTFSFVRPQTLRKVFFVGEVMPVKHLRYWRDALENVQFVNLYGQSELAGICCSYEVRDLPEDMTVLPMGKAMPNCKIYLLDGDEIVTEPDRIGEMYLTSPALSLGYYRDEEKTRASFLYKDFGEGPVRCFKTGDLARLDAQGNYLFAARSDFQIKHMGHRIELGEIEAVAGKLEQIEQCCCLYDADRSKIVLFACLQTGCTLTGKEIQSLLRPRLSSYMLPSKVKIMDALPLNANGKIDRVRLRDSL